MRSLDRLHAVLVLITQAYGLDKTPVELEQLTRELTAARQKASYVSIARGLEHWMRWWKTSKLAGLPGDANTLEAYICSQEQGGNTCHTIDGRISAIRRTLRAINKIDPNMERVFRQSRKARNIYSERYQQRPLQRQPLGWADIRKIVQAADQNCRHEVRTVAAMLVLFESMARPRQIFGQRVEREWILPPTTRAHLQQLADGTGRLALGQDGRGVGKRDVRLSKLAMSWLERSFTLWPKSNGTLFTAENGEPMAIGCWIKYLKRLLKRHGLEHCTTSSIRLGMAKDLIEKGVHILDVQESAAWAVRGPALRLIPRAHPKHEAQHFILYENDSFATPLPKSIYQTPCTGDLFAYHAHD